MRLGLIIYGDLDTLSGGYVYDRMLVEHLRHAGDEVILISLPWQIYPLRLRHNLMPWLQRRLRDLPVDILLQDELNHPSLFSLNPRIRREVNYPIVSIVHHLRSSEQHPGLAMWLYRQVERKYLNSVNGYIFNSRTTQTEVARLSGHAAEGVVAYPGGDRFQPGLDEEAIRRRVAQPGPLRILFVGNLIARKGLHTLLAALARLPDEGWRLDVVGQAGVDPVYSARQVEFVHRHGLEAQVRFWGKLPEEGLRQMWASSHVLAVPSQYEGFGIVYLEGMSFGLPAIASTAGAASEIITDGQDGFLVPPDEVSALTDRLAELVENRAQLSDMSVAARSRFVDFPTWQESMQAARAYLLRFGSKIN